MQSAGELAAELACSRIAGIEDDGDLQAGPPSPVKAVEIANYEVPVNYREVSFIDNWHCVVILIGGEESQTHFRDIRLIVGCWTVIVCAERRCR